MIIRDFKSQFQVTTPVSESFISLMQSSFRFYADFCSRFFQNLAIKTQENQLDTFIQNELRTQLFDPALCETLEETKKKFLEETIKLEQFKKETSYSIDFLNDLDNLKAVSDKIYNLLQKHWELYKYEQSAVNNQKIIEFVLEIDQIGVTWDSYLEKYLAVSKVLSMAGGPVEKAGNVIMEIKYHLPEGEETTLELLTGMIQLMQLVYEFVEKMQGNEEASSLEVSQLEVSNPMSCLLQVPEASADTFRRMLKYMTVDVLKKETLIKYVMEIVRLQEGQDIPKQAITAFHKKISAQLGALHPEGFLSVDEEMPEDSIEIMTALCREMDSLKIQYDKLLQGSTDKLTRNRLDVKKAKTELPTEENKEETLVKVEPRKEDAATKADINSKEEKADEKVDVSKKQHIGYLTS